MNRAAVAKDIENIAKRVDDGLIIKEQLLDIATRLNKSVREERECLEPNYFTLNCEIQTVYDELISVKDQLISGMPYSVIQPQINEVQSKLYLIDAFAKYVSGDPIKTKTIHNLVKTKYLIDKS